MANNTFLTFPLRAFRILNKRDQRILFFYTFLQFLLSALDLLAVLLLAFSVNLLQSSKALSDYQLKLMSFFEISMGSTEQNSRIGVYLVFIAMSLMILKTICTMLLSKQILIFLGKKSAETTLTNLEVILSKPELVLDQESTQGTLFSISRGVELLMVQIVGTFILLTSDVFLFLILLATIVMVDPFFGIPLVLMLFLIGLFLHVKTNKKAMVLGSAHTHLNIRSAELITELLANFRVIFVRNSQSLYLKELSAIRNKMIKVTAGMNYLPYFTKFVLETGIILVSGLMGLIAFLLSDKPSAVNTVVLVLASASRIAPAAVRIQQGILTIKSTEGQAQGAYQLISQLSETPKFSSSLTKKLEWSNTNLEQYGVMAVDMSFSYPGNSDLVLDEVNFEIPSGKVVAIVGKSGSGKSTLADLILGLRIPISGEILIGGRSPRDVVGSNTLISYVPQGVKLSKGTIRDFLSLGEDRVYGDSELISILHTASFQIDNVSPLELLDYWISEAGENFSGGQSQRLALAKALLSEPKLIILDEITNAQDQNKEYEMFTNLKNDLEGTTIILISHSNQVRSFVDLILEIEERKVIVKPARS
jgi:ABC-type multidrug transport system fused ATPase/permease subunit